MPLLSGQLTGLRKTQGVYNRVTADILNMDFKILDSKCHVLANFSVTPNGKVPALETHIWGRLKRLWRMNCGVQLGVLHI